MEAFLLDWGVSDDGHRMNIQQPDTSAQNAYRDVGIGLVNTSGTSSVGPLVVTQDFARPGQRDRPRSWASPTTTPTAPGPIPPGEGSATSRSPPSTSRPARSALPRPGLPAATSSRWPRAQYQLIASHNNQVIN